MERCDYMRIADGLKDIMKKGYKKIVVYPYGEIGRCTKQVLLDEYNIDIVFAVDNVNFNNEDILNFESAVKKDEKDYVYLICNNNNQCYREVRDIAYSYIEKERIIDLFPRSINEFCCIERINESFDVIEDFLRELDN